MAAQAFISECFDIAFIDSNRTPVGIFYGPDGKCPLSNFWSKPFISAIYGHCGSREHAYQRTKFNGPNKNLFDKEYRANLIKGMSSGDAALFAARKIKHLIQQNWLLINESVMENVVEENIKTDAELQQYIYAIMKLGGKIFIVEHTAKDAFWGDGGDGTGQNMLGKLWMRILYGMDVKPPDNYFAWLEKKQRQIMIGNNVLFKSFENMCPQCHVKARYVDSNGKTHDACSRTCNAKYLARAHVQAPAHAHVMCRQCHVIPCYVDLNGKIHKTCSRTCSTRYLSHAQVQVRAQQPASTHIKCRQCRVMPCYIEPNGTVHTTCSKTCAGLYYNRK